MSSASSAHVIGIVGGAVSGSVAAEILAEKGCQVVVFEQNVRPYGKIEDGLPRWHKKLRAQEYQKIDERLGRPSIHFVPKTRLGKDIAFDELAKSWGLSVLLLANGAWRDRPLEVPGVDDYVGRGLVYQNPLIYWFNHKNEAAYSGLTYEIPDGSVCVGGGLASIDVIKVIQLEIYERALKKKGVECTMYDLEHQGIAEYLKKKSIDPASLGVTNGLLIYRRRAEDMPLADVPPNPTPEQLKKAETTRKKLLEIAQRKFMFRFEDRRLSREALVEGGRMVGLKVVETKVDGKKAEPIPGSEREVRAPLVISSIGSVPERIAGIQMKGETYTFKSWDTGELDGIPGVYGIGNVCTGKGNIRDSLEHGEFVARHVAANYLGLGDSREVPGLTASAEAAGAANAERIAERLTAVAPLPASEVERILGRVKARQREVGMDGDYASWMKTHTPADLE